MASRTRRRRTTTSTARRRPARQIRAAGRSRTRRGAERSRRSSARLGAAFKTELDRPKDMSTGVSVLLKLGLRPHQSAGAAILLALAAVTILLFRNPGFYVWGISVEGGKWVNADQVYRVAGLDSMSIFYVDPLRVSRSLEQLPGVKSATVHCGLPNLVTIRMVERSPAAIWQSNGVQHWVDAEGTLFPRFADMANPLVIVEQDSIDRQSGDMVDHRVVETVQGLHALLPDVRVFGYSRADGLLFQLSNGRQVMARVGCDPTRVASALVAVEQESQVRHISPGVLDLRYDTRAFWR